MEHFDKKEAKAQPPLNLFFKNEYFTDYSSLLNEVDLVNVKAKKVLPKFK